MGHRHVFSPPYMFETENDQRWNFTDHPYPHIAQSSAESGTITYPPDNMLIDGAQCASHCSLAPVWSVQNPHYNQDTAGPLDNFPENSRNNPSSSNYSSHNIQEDDSFDIRGSNGRWQYKRKSSVVPERDGTNGYNNDAGSSSKISIPIEPWEETPNIDFLHTPWAHHGGNGLSFGAESSLRNVRSRVAVDLEADLSRTNNFSHDYYATSQPMDIIPSPGHLLGPISYGSMREWNPTRTSASVRDGSLNPFLMGSSNPNTSIETGGHNNDLVNGSSFQGPSVQPVRGTRGNCIQRPAPTFRSSSSTLRLGHEQESQLPTNNYSFRHPRPSSTIAWRSGDQNGHARMTIERHRLFSGETNFGYPPAPDGLMIVDRSAFYGSRNPFDQHRDMRLDIDDMSYEELLALGERIGSVSTGLSEDLISKCLTESIYCSSDQIQDEDEGTCVICLEEYANMDDVGILKACRHDFHVNCIKKWLKMKNLCPICKAEPMKHK